MSAGVSLFYVADRVWGPGRLVWCGSRWLLRHRPADDHQHLACLALFLPRTRISIVEWKGATFRRTPLPALILIETDLFFSRRELI